VCPIADDETLTECRVFSAHVVAAGTYDFHKTLHIENGGSIQAPAGVAALTLNIDGASEAAGGQGGALLMDTDASMIITDDTATNASAAPINITTAGNVIMQAGSLISARNFPSGAGTAGTGGGGAITIDVNGDKMVMCGPAANVAFDAACSTNAATGATITSDKNGGGECCDAGNITIHVGNFPGFPPTGTFLMDTGSIVRANSTLAAGDIVIDAGLKVEIDGQVLSQVLSGSTGTGATQGRDGGSIMIDAGCVVHISETGLISSFGQDAGADLVHLSGCKVLIEGILESSGEGHGTPNSPPNHCNSTFRPGKPSNSTGCIEVWGGEIAITNTAELRSDINLPGNGGTEGESWIDLFALGNISITGRTGAADTFAVHADTASGSDSTPNTVTVKSTTGTVTASGKALSASIIGTANGSRGGAIVVEASGLVDLDTATLKARGDNSGGGGDPCDGGSGACGQGGTIDVRSFNNAVSWQNGVGDVNPDAGVSPPAGNITITACTTVTTTGTNFDDETPTVSAVNGNPPNSEQCGGAPTLPSQAAGQYDVIFHTEIWEHCAPATKSGVKFEDTNEDGIKDPGEPPIAGWPINLYKNNAPFASTNTGLDGKYSFTNLGPGSYRVCEGAGPPLYTQSYPNAGTPVPPGEAIVNTCPAPNTWGYEFTVGGQTGAFNCCPDNGQTFENNDFGNHRTPTECQKQTVNDVMDLTYPGNSGPDVTVKTWLGESVQTAVDNAADTNGDKYIIVMVVAKPDFSLGGSANQKVEVTRNDYAKPFGLFGCSVTLTGGGTDPAVWVKSTAASPQITVNGKPTTIFVMDLHGANSAVGVQADGTKRYLRNEDATGNTTGIVVNGNYNVVHNGSAEANGRGIVVTGNNNSLTDTDVFSNTGVGVTITGNKNSATKLDVGDKGKGNGGDGFYVRGNGNKLVENEALANGGDGFDVAGGTASAANVLKKNVAGERNNGNAGNGFFIGADTGSGTSNPIELEENTAQANGLNGFLVNGAGHQLKKNISGNSGSGYDNGDCEFKVVAGNFNGTGNKSNNVTVAGANNTAFSTACIGTP
jgi:hypothetical protein